MAEEFQLQNFLLELMQLMQAQSSVWLTGSSLIRYNTDCHLNALPQRCPQIFFCVCVWGGGGDRARAEFLEFVVKNSCMVTPTWWYELEMF
jgi:hypothetical protein